MEVSEYGAGDDRRNEDVGRVNHKYQRVDAHEGIVRREGGERHAEPEKDAEECTAQGT